MAKGFCFSIRNETLFIFVFRAKCIKNSVTVNEELTAEEWKRRWEKEREKVARLKGQLARAELELERWRRGETVTKDEQINLLDPEEILPTTQSTMSLSTVASTSNTSALPPLALGNPLAANVNNDEWEKERTALYQQLDEKVRRKLIEIRSLFFFFFFLVGR